MYEILEWLYINALSNRIDPDQTQQNTVSYQDLHVLLKMKNDTRLKSPKVGVVFSSLPHETEFYILQLCRLYIVSFIGSIYPKDPLFRK